MTRGARVDPRIGAAVAAVLAGRLTLLQRRALADLLVVSARGDAPATVHESAVDALAPVPGHRRPRPRSS